MITFICPKCGQERTAQRKRCYPCTNASQTPESREKIRQTLTGVKHTSERRKNNSDARKKQIADGQEPFNLAGYMQDKPHPFALPTGTERIVKDGRMTVKCEDGKWRYRSRLMWEAAYGPITSKQIVHHVNEDPMDDRLENFQLVTRAEHMKIHHHS